MCVVTGTGIPAASPAFRIMFTVCGHAHETCPVFPSPTRIVHVGFDDPPTLAMTAKSETEALGHYRRVRDEIKSFVENLPDNLDPAA